MPDVKFAFYAPANSPAQTLQPARGGSFMHTKLPADELERDSLKVIESENQTVASRQRADLPCQNFCQDRPPAGIQRLAVPVRSGSLERNLSFLFSHFFQGHFPSSPSELVDRSVTDRYPEPTGKRAPSAVSRQLPLVCDQTGHNFLGQIFAFLKLPVCLCGHAAEQGEVVIRKILPGNAAAPGAGGGEEEILVAQALKLRTGGFGTTKPILQGEVDGRVLAPAARIGSG